MTKDQLKYLSNSEAWQGVRDYLLVFIKELDSVSRPLIVNGITISPEQAYLSKLLSVETLEEFINSVDSFKNIEERSKDGRDSME